MILVENLFGGGVDLDDKGLCAVGWLVADLPEGGTGFDVLATGGGEGTTKIGRAGGGGDSQRSREIDAQLPGGGELVERGDIIVWGDVDLLVDQGEVLARFRENIEIAFVGLGLAKPVFSDSGGWVFVFFKQKTAYEMIW